MAQFAAASAAGQDWRDCVRQVLDKLGQVEGANLGIVYVSDLLVGDADPILRALRDATGVADWVGTVGIGVCGSEGEYFDKPAIAALVGALPRDGFTLLPKVTDAAAMGATGDWLKTHSAMLALVHADPRTPDLADLVGDVAAASETFLTGGLASSRGDLPHFAGPRPTTGGGVSGVLFSDTVPVATGLTQGCQPIGKPHTITKADGNVLIELDDRPALDVFKEDLAALPQSSGIFRGSGDVHAALPVLGSDTGDYLVRNLMGIDAEEGMIGIGEMVEVGQQVMFVHRDRDTATADLSRMLAGLKRRVGDGTPKAGVYVSCLARGPNTFGPNSVEVKTIRRELGDFPLVGFFANGEISNNRLYGYTGVLTLFL